MTLFVHSGEVRLCAVGTATGATDLHDKPLSTGDIVLIYTGEYVADYPTVIVRDEYRSFVGGAHLPVDLAHGIAGVEKLLLHLHEQRIGNDDGIRRNRSGRRRNGSVGRRIIGGRVVGRVA